MRKYNYFDDDQDDIQSLISSFDAPREVKKEKVEKELKNIESSKIKENKTEKPKAPKKQSPKKEAKPEKPEIKEEKKPIFEPVKVVQEEEGLSLEREQRAEERAEKRTKRKKRRVTLALVLVFFASFGLMVYSTVNSVDSENKRIAQFNADAAKLCSQYITRFGNCSYENLYSSYGVAGNRMNGLCYVREIDFNNDNVSELLLCYNDSGVYYTEVWGYNSDSKFINLYHDKSTQTTKKTDDAWITLYSKSNKYFIGVHSGKNFEKVELLGLRKNLFEKKYDAEYDADAHAFSINEKVDSSSFERIKLAVLVEEKAVSTVNQVSKTIESFLGTNGVANLLSDSQSLQNAYYSVVDEYNQTYGKAKLVKKSGLAYISGLAVVDLVDFNGDGKDELVMIYRKGIKVRDTDAQGNYVAKIEDRYYVEIYRYNGNKAVLTYKGESISNSLSDSADEYYIIKKKNSKAYYCVNSFSSQEYGRIVNASSTIFKFDGSQFTQQSKASYKTNYGYTEYFINDEQVYSSTFKEKGYSVPLFNGESKYDENTYSVTFLQRKLLKAEDMQTTINTTISNIQTLYPSYSGETE